jgi:hypothetical protein
MPVTQPTTSFHVREGRNDPCPQSCMMMKVRIVNPAAGSASNRVSQ